MAQGNHIYTSGATGTNAAVIRGALRAEKPDLLTVVLPQSLSMQPPESQELLADVSMLVFHVPFAVLWAARSGGMLLGAMHSNVGPPANCNFTCSFAPAQVKNVVSKPEADHLSLVEASRCVPLVWQSYDASMLSTRGTCALRLHIVPWT